tara:strand:- start:987 stop:1646 length:660 start_codon:yes stop_codon:yes gene_type:complete
MSFSWYQRSGNLGNPQRVQNSKPRWRDSSESSRALDRKVLRNANTIAYNKPIMENFAYVNNNWGNVGPSPLTQQQLVEPGLGTLGWAIGALTPFRALMNAGDPNNTYNSPQWGPSSQVPASGAGSVGRYINNQYTHVINQVSSTKRSSNSGWKSAAGRVPTSQTTSGASAWTGNNKYVYDGSDYVRFKKLQAKNRNYNDPTFGGDEHNASQVPRARARR